MKKIIILLLSCQILTAQSQQILLDEIVAVVDESVIMRSELDRSVASITKQFQASGNQLPPQDILQKQVLERLIIQDIQVQRANLAGVRVSDAELESALARIGQQNNITLDQMRQTVEQDGFSFAAFREDMRKEMLAERVRYGYANSQVKVSEHEIDLFLADNELDQGEVEVNHILISTPQEAGPDDIQKAKQKADSVYSQLQQGESFAVLAARNSDGQNALEGGRLGWRPINQLPTLFSDQLKIMNIGETTRPIRSPSGFHILQLTDKRDESAKLVQQFNALHLMIETNPVITPKEGMQIANDLHQQIVDGADFAELAEEHSDDHASAPLGGDMGWFEQNAYGDRFGNVVVNLSDGEVSRPFQTEAGWHIVKRLNSRETDVSEEFQRNQASRAIRERKIQEEIESWVRQIRGEAFVDIRL
ncbi:peptidylprolyl isomerase [Marinicella sp. W31]|uniref:peptidylprolyl isomerase n=1 Tax=Marinicella sp. W31 TaxID=3023713 RepID=UPI003756B313